MEERPAVTGMELADAVEAVRQGLMTGAARGASSAIRFEVSEIRMEFTVQLSRTSGSRGGVKAWVVEAGGDRSRTDGHTHTVSLTLHPKNARTGGHVDITAPREGEDASLAYED